MADTNVREVALPLTSMVIDAGNILSTKNKHAQTGGQSGIISIIGRPVRYRRRENLWGFVDSKWGGSALRGCKLRKYHLRDLKC